MVKQAKKLRHGIYLVFITAGLFFLVSIYSFLGIEDILLQQKVKDYEQHIELLTDRVDYNQRIGVSIEDNAQPYKLMETMGTLDEQPMIFAAVYQYNHDTLQRISTRAPSYKGVYFDPLVYPEFYNSIYENFHERDKTHTIKVWFEAPEVTGRDMYISYRWTPQAHSSVSYLLVTGISVYSLDVEIPITVYLLATLRVVIMALIGFWLLENLNRLLIEKANSPFIALYGGDRYDNR